MSSTYPQNRGKATIEKWTDRFIRFWPSPLGKAFGKLVLVLLEITALCFLFKYTFFVSCIPIPLKGIQSCTGPASIGNDSIVALGALLIAVVTLIPLFSIESRVSEAKKEVEQRVYAQLERNLELVPEAYDYLQKAMTSAQDWRFGDALYFASLAQETWPRYKQEIDHFLVESISNYLVMAGSKTYHSLTATLEKWDRHADLYFDVRHDSLGRSFYRHQALALKGIELIQDWHPEPSEVAEKYKHLALLYGYKGTYFAMHDALKQAVRNEEIKKAMPTPERLIMLVRACDNDFKLGIIGQLLDISLPIDKQQFVARLQQQIWKSGGYLLWYVVLKKLVQGEVALRVIKLHLREEQGKRLWYAAASNPGDPNDITSLVNYEEISEEELYKRIESDFFLIAVTELKP